MTGLYVGTATGPALDTFTYNDDGTLASRSEPPSATSAAYTWDPIGRLTSQSDTLSANNVSWNFTINPASQIASETRNNDAYAYTGLVNVNHNYGVNGLNQYTSAGSTSFTYDTNGNLTSDGTHSYTYDIENHLVSMVSGSVTVTLTYDPLGRLFEVLKQTSGTTNSDTKFIYDGDKLTTEYDGSNNFTVRYNHGSNAAADDPLVYWPYTGGVWYRYFLHADHEGSIVALEENTGSVLINKYDEYGIPQTDGSGNNLNTGRFQYTGQEWIPELGMYYYKARMYSPSLGRFMQTDPIGYKDQINLYEYVGDDPVDNNDPSGRELFGAVAGATFSAGLDYATQVGGNLAEGKSWKDSLWTDIDGTSIAISAVGGAVAGATGVGVPSVINKFFKTETALVKAANALQRANAITKATNRARRLAQQARRAEKDAAIARSAFRKAAVAQAAIQAAKRAGKEAEKDIEKNHKKDAE